MSRIFIENLPKNINENELRLRFSQKGEITDIQLRKDKSNAFIGFKIDDAAKEAVDYFNKTFIQSSRISVKIAQAFRIKKTELKNDITKEDVPKLKKFDPFEEIKDDPEFGEFLKVQRNIDLGKGKQIWNDDVADNLNKTVDEDEKDESNHEVETEEKEEDELPKNKMSKVSFEFTAKIKGLPYKFKKKQLKEFFLPVKPLSLRLVPNVKGIAYISFKTEKDLNQSLVKHRGFLDGHRIEIVRFKVKTNETNVQNNTKSVDSKKVPKWKNAEPAAEEIGESGRIYVRNLSYTCTEDDLRNLFESFGALTELHMPIDSYTKKPKGFAFVTFVFPEHAVRAFESLDKTDFQGRLLHLLPAHAKSESVSAPPPPPLEEESGDNNVDNSQSDSKKISSFKDKKKDEVKKEANNPVNWNTLFIRPNAVADIMSKKFNVNKIDLLTKSNKSDNVAVRMALGETQIVNEVRQFLTKNKVSLDSFSRGASCSRSNSVILVKNLPADTTDDEIIDLFQNFGLVNRVILPPYGITAIVEMQEPNEAKFAFKKLAYSNFKHYPLYLEWAPSDIFDFNESATKKNEDQNVEPVLEELPEDNSTIFVKNLNFNTDEDDFREHFAKIGRIFSATIAKKKTPQGQLSLGYGFVQYFKASDASDAIKKLQNSSLNQHKLELKFSNRTANKPADELKNKSTTVANQQQKQTSSKICVKNIPFEATVKDIQKLFSVYGQIKSVRLPKKLTGSSSYRGFGFVDFVSKEDAKRAFDALSHSTHLYGRALVLEWAKSESNGDDLLDNQEAKQVAAKTARYFGSVDNSEYGSSSKRLKRSDLVNELEKPYSSHTRNDMDVDSDD